MLSAAPTGGELRERLRAARLCLLFTPELAGVPAELLDLDAAPDEVAGALARLEAALPFVDVVQVRPKPLADVAAVTAARAALAWTERVLDLVAARAERPLVVVNDRVDVAGHLSGRGVAGCHLGQDDAPPEVAREALGPDLLIGLSTHDALQVAAAELEPVDYLGFGPVFATGTKGYDRGLGPERAFVASRAVGRPVFAIGGIGVSNVGELAEVGRVAVGSAILAAVDPGTAAREIAELLAEADASL